MSRLVLDANILLTAFAGRPAAPPALLLAAVHNGDIEGLQPPAIDARTACESIFHLDVSPPMAAPSQGEPRDLEEPEAR